MWSEISSQDLPYPSRNRCSNTYQAPYWKTFTAQDTTLHSKSSSPISAPRVIRSDSVASVNRVSCSISPLQSLPYPTRVKSNDLPSYLSTYELTSVSDNKVKNQQLLSLKSLYRNPDQMHSLPKCPNQHYELSPSSPTSPTSPSRLTVSTNNPCTPLLSTALCATPSSLYIDVQQLLAPSKTTLPELYTMDTNMRRIRFVRSSLNIPLYDLQLRREVHTPTPQMKRHMGSLKVQGLNRTFCRNSKNERRV
ncbi:hypothetical protein LOD99_13815 [Oopsacas minuta]|uniref:Uncharacterized protein n=1 Tax=Oopsacas minuta TaxID=111878 RepID=A0AAV7KJD8_9METZ|nr:hypothetical protein LOD99_13815 [Oopsacas minuta]